MKVVDVQYVEVCRWIGFLFDTGAKLFYGAGVRAGTDIVTYRFIHSSGFDGSQKAYKGGKELACEYSRGLGFSGVQEHLESFMGARRFL